MGGSMSGGARGLSQELNRRQRALSQQAGEIKAYRNWKESNERGAPEDCLRLANA